MPEDPTKIWSKEARTAPADNAYAVTPSDSADLPIAPRALYIGTGGGLKITTAGGQTVNFDNLPNGSILPVRAYKVFATGQNGSIATGIVALY